MVEHAAKPIGEITNDELISSAVWEFVLDNEDTLDETAIRPVTKLPVTTGSGIIFCAQIRLNCGQKLWALLGNLDPHDTESTSQYLTITILKGGRRFHLARQIDFDYATRGPRALGEFVKLKLEDIFPIYYDVSSFCRGGPATAGAIKL